MSRPLVPDDRRLPTAKTDLMGLMNEVGVPYGLTLEALLDRLERQETDR